MPRPQSAYFVDRNAGNFLRSEGENLPIKKKRFYKNYGRDSLAESICLLPRKGTGKFKVYT